MGTTPLAANYFAELLEQLSLCFLSMQTVSMQQLEQLYLDAAASADAIGLAYVSDTEPGIDRRRQGKGFCYLLDGSTIDDKETTARLKALTIPPAWQDVWICADPAGHIQVTGRDEQGRKQYIYHQKWRAMRDLINFYRLLLFGRDLPKIRKTIEQQLQRRTWDKMQAMAAMLWLLDNGHMRIGNDVYFMERESIGLSTMLDSTVEISGAVMTYNFKGKSGKEQAFELEDKKVAQIVQRCKDVPGERLFQYYDEQHQPQPITSTDINDFLSDITQHKISAKDFRTWGGTVAAFDHLIADHRKNTDKKPEKVVIEAVDKAAEELGNTRAIARKSYVHPHILETYGTKNFAKYYRRAQKQPSKKCLSKREVELLGFLEQLFETEFSLLKK
jgi:DNA topoisomerase-1